MDEKTYSSLVSRLNQLRKGASKTTNAQTLPTILFLEEELTKTSDSLNRAALYQLLSQEYAFANSPDNEISTMRRAAAEFLNEPVPWIGLAARLSHDQRTLGEAKNTIERALEIAIRTDRFVRYALGTRARIANASGDFKLLEDTIQRLIADSTKTRIEDSGFETDFLDSIPDSTIDQGTREQYLQIVRNKRE